MSDKANFNSMGNDFTVRFGLDDLSGRAKHQLFRALLESSGVLTEGPVSEDVEKFLTRVMNNLWEQK